ncbi:hypothetical protein [Paraliomyxa miuraensis]|uniref:hypothetical protein n=1 Tax=Paraliomyxa miuraensis TaxID=376150 RepID=UPI002259FDE6|nr:hypothetical protein [Paraliomyxa miuraensis]MCX4240633.1 hypothetical protein [Paraliomyxa miuraensis]
MKTEDERNETVLEPLAEVNPLEALLDEHQARRETPGPGPMCLMGRVIDDRHPTLGGRVRVRWRAANGSTQERWLLTLQGLPVRTEDRVLMLCPEGSEEPVVTGVLDGFARRPELERSGAAQVELRRDEAVRIVGATGEPLLEIHEGESGPVVTVLHEDLELAVPGRVRIRGRQVQLEATAGAVEVDATDEVALRGEVVKLN